jgi:hypothetical protein
MAFTLKCVLYLLFTCTSLLANAKTQLTDFSETYNYGSASAADQISLWNSVSPKLHTQIKINHIQDH